MPKQSNTVTLRRKGIFFLIEGQTARELAQKLGLKLIEKKITNPDGTEEIKISCGFPRSGLDKYIGKLVRMGRNVIVKSDGETIEEIKIQ